MKHKKLFLGLTAFLIVLIGVFLAIRHMGQTADYKLIRKEVASHTLNGKITEASSSNATECYPEPNSKRVCKQIVYTMSADSCIQVVEALGQGEACKATSISMEFDDANFMYVVSPGNNQPTLRVTLVSKH